MKPAFETVQPAANASFLVRRFVEKQFSAPYHFHPEVELTYIVQGQGKRYVGTHMHDYFAGDLVLLGANLPHCWKSEVNPEHDSVSVVVQFKPNFLGDAFFNRPELEAIESLLQKSNHGLHFTRVAASVTQRLVQLLAETDPFQKLVSVLHVLHALAQENAYTLLDHQTAYLHLSLAEKERIKNVMAYIVDNFQQRISLTEAAAVANLTPQAFCKYFKRHTRKTFLEAVIDYRLDFAVQQLVHTENAVAQVAFDSGFEDPSNFYKTFKCRFQQSPLHYRNAFAKKAI